MNLCFSSSNAFSSFRFVVSCSLNFYSYFRGIFGTDKTKSKKLINNLNLLETGDLKKIKGLQGKYITLMRYCLDNPKKLIVLTLVFLVFIQILYSKYGKGFEFFPPIEPDYAEIVVHARGNLSADEKDTIIKNVENEVLKISLLEISTQGVDLFKVIKRMKQMMLLAL